MHSDPGGALLVRGVPALGVRSWRDVTRRRGRWAKAKRQPNHRMNPTRAARIGGLTRIVVDALAEAHSRNRAGLALAS